MMMKQISIDNADTQALLQSDSTIILDIRDQQSFQQSHIPNANNITMHGLTVFCESTEKDVPIVVCCYHGISSQTVAEFLIGQGFTTVYSLMGGFEAYRAFYLALNSH